MTGPSASTFTTFTWILHPYDQAMPALRDEFLVGAFRLVLAGDSVQLLLEDSPAVTREQEAREFAETYARGLGRGLGLFLHLQTENELGSLPAYACDSVQFPHAHRVCRDPRLALREARNELLTRGNETLRSSYNYIQDATEHPRESLFYLYKAIEAIENELGGEKAAINTLNIAAPLKSVKRLANESERDERHAPSDPGKVRQPTPTEKDGALADTKTVLRAYEKYLRTSGKI